MGFQQGLSGLNVSGKALDAIGNNVSNANTIGFKSSSAIFADVYASALSGGGAGQVGIGASVPKIAQQFTQGNLTVTNNPLDLAINGDGMFRLSNNGTISYSRNGQFQVNSSGFIISSGGLHLTGYAADPITGTIVPGNYVDLQVNTTNIPPNATTAANVLVNLDSRSTTPAAMTAGTLTGSASPASLDITAANNAVTLTIDGLVANVTIPIATYSSVGNLVTAVETAINTNPTLAAANVAADVTLDTSGQIVITSRSAGTQGSQGIAPGSSVAVTAGAGATNLLGAAPVQANGTDNFDIANTLSYTASTAQTEYDSLGNPHNLTMYFVKTGQPKTWQVYTALDGTVAGATAVVAATQGTTSGIPGATITLNAANNQINVQVNGTTKTISLTQPATYDPTVAANMTALALDLETQINAALPGGFGPAAATVTYSGGQLVFTSAATGGSSSITVTDGTLTAAALLGTATTVPGTAASSVTTPTPTLINFSAAGSLLSTPTIAQTFTLTNGATSPFSFSLDLTGTTQYGITFGVNQLTQDGYTSGRLSGMSVSSDGTVLGKYSNGKSRNMGQLVLAKFNNPNGLSSIGGNQWAETAESGQPIPGTPGQGSLGLIQSAAVEESNVDLTAELVNMITQQRVYQANAQTIKTQDQVLQTLVNLR